LAGIENDDTFRVEVVMLPALMVEATIVEKTVVATVTVDTLNDEKTALFPYTSFVSTLAVSKRILYGNDPCVIRPAHPELSAGSVR
jgi:hypothetical protein